MVLKRQRFPSGDMIERLSKDLGLTEKEHRYFELLVLLEKRSRTKQSTATLVDELSKLNPSRRSYFYDYRKYSRVSKWYFFVIKQLVETSDFNEDPKWIRSKIRAKITLSEIKHAIQTMLEVGILIRNEDGRLTPSFSSTQWPSDKPHPCGQKHLQQMLVRSIEAVEELPPKEREFDAQTFRMDPARTSEAKHFFREFRDSFIKRFHQTDATQVYQMNFQLFDHTQKPKR